jgi:hypothetical protein
MNRPRPHHLALAATAAAVLLAAPFLSAQTPVLIAADANLPDWAARLTGPGELRIAVPSPLDPRWAHLSWPKAIRTPSGTIVLAYLAGEFHGTGGGKSPAVSLSTDGGRTFTAPQILREFSAGAEYTSSGNVALGLAGDGAVVLLAMGYRGNEANNIYGWRSTDDGKTWSSTDTSTLGPNKTGSVVGRVLSLPGGRLIVFGHYRPGSSPHEHGIWCATSRDQGRSWGRPRTVMLGDVVEPVAVQAGGRLLVLIRDNSSGPGSLDNARQHLAISDDDGETWKTELSPTVAKNATTHRLAQPFVVNRPGNATGLIVLTTERARSGGTPGSLWLWRADIRNLDWRRERVILEFPRIEDSSNTDFGYPWLLPVANDRWLMFYYHGQKHGPNPIWVAEIQL